MRVEGYYLIVVCLSIEPDSSLRLCGIRYQQIRCHY